MATNLKEVFKVIILKEENVKRNKYNIIICTTTTTTIGFSNIYAPQLDGKVITFFVHVYQCHYNSERQNSLKVLFILGMKRNK